MRIILFLLATLFAADASSQAVQRFEASNGSYEISYYAENILKLKFTPRGYDRGENISDAVMLPPLRQAPASAAAVSGDKIVFRNRLTMLQTDTVQGYWSFRFSLQNGERIYGGGERALPLDRRGQRFNLHNNPWYGYGENADNLNYSVPFFTSNKGYAVFFDNPSSGFADIGKKDPAVFEVGFSSGELNVYVLFGSDYQSILRSYHKLTGTQPLPPRWAFGNLMSRFGYTSETQSMGILEKMENELIPVDAIIFDLFWFGDSIKGTLGNLDWVNKTKWPDPRKMIGGLKQKGIQTILVTEPFFVETSRNYEQSKKYLAVDSAGKPYLLRDFYFGRGGLLDIFRSDARDWFWNFYKKQMDLGVEAWWGDLGEPEKHPQDLYHNLRDLGHRRLFAANEVHNIYGHYWTKMLFQKYSKTYPGKRLFSLNRSGFAGSQRIGIFPWTGDVSRSWTGLRAQLPVLLGMTMSGVPYVHSDAGGFAGGEGDYELYLRWLQFAAFTPILRPHGTALYEVEPQAFSFPSEAALLPDPWKGMAREAIHKRYSLLPYNYTLAYEQAVNGAPLMAPMYYHFPSDTTVSTLQDQFMWGSSILVAPVLEKGQQQRRFYLPAGKWYNLGRRKMLDGGQWHSQPVPLHDFPLLFREGSFVVMNENFRQNTSGYKGDSLGVFYVASEKPSTYRLYNDDGKNKNAVTKRQYQLVHFSSTGVKDKKLQIRVVADKGVYPGKPSRRTFMFTVATERLPAKVMVNGKPAGKLVRDAASGCVFFDVRAGAQPVNILMTW